MLDQDGSRYDREVAPERERSQSSAGTVAGLERQVRETVEGLRLKLENLKLFLSWRR
jgi:hypothetical protein